MRQVDSISVVMKQVDSISVVMRQVDSVSIVKWKFGGYKAAILYIILNTVQAATGTRSWGVIKLQYFILY